MGTKNGTPPGPQRGDTRTRLILAAERLFGERGIHAVTLKEINAAAGQRNESALHYHFGSKHALVEAILLYRVRIVDARRIELLDALLERDKKPGLRAIVHAAFEPMAELLETQEGVRFVRFLAQVLNDPDFDLPSLVLGSDFEGIARTNALVVSALGDLPPGIALQRQRFLIEMTVSSLAIWTRQHDAARERDARALFVANLFDSIVGFLSAPVSAETLAALKKAPGADRRKAGRKEAKQ
jgi:AcrR family transcriptional regulator